MKPAALLAILLLFAAVAPAQSTFIDITPKPGSPVKKIQAQLDATIIPEFKIANATLSEAIELIMKKAREADPKSKPVPIVIDPELLKPDPAVDPHLGKLADVRFTLSVVSIPESKLLNYVTKLAGLHYRVTFTGVSIEGCNIDNQQIVTRRYSLLPKFLGANGADDAKIAQALAGEGVVFPVKSSVHYDAARKILTVRNTQENLDLIDEIVAMWRTEAKPPR